jgi:hypothetical protein
MSKDKFVISGIEGIVVTKKGSKPVESAKVTKSLEEALAEVQLEWIEE